MDQTRHYHYILGSVESISQAGKQIKKTEKPKVFSTEKETWAQEVGSANFSGRLFP